MTGKWRGRVLSIAAEMRWFGVVGRTGDGKGNGLNLLVKRFDRYR